MAKYCSKVVSVGVGEVVTGNEEAERGSGAGGGAGEIGPVTTGNAKLDARSKGEAEAVLDNVGRPDHTELVTAGTVGTVKPEVAGNAEPEKIGKAADKIGSALLVLAALVSALEKDRKAFNILSAF